MENSNKNSNENSKKVELAHLSLFPAQSDALAVAAARRGGAHTRLPAGCAIFAHDMADPDPSWAAPGLGGEPPMLSHRQNEFLSCPVRLATSPGPRFEIMMLNSY